jgi:hypothetical protein
MAITREYFCLRSSTLWGRLLGNAAAKLANKTNLPAEPQAGQNDFVPDAVRRF